MKKIYILDISAFFFRSYYALPPNMKSKKGTPTNALYGVTSMLINLIKKKKPDYIVCCFDTKEPSFRKEIYPEYKANRGEMPEDLVAQVPYLKQLVKYMGIHRMEQVGYEADDLIGSLAILSNNKNLQTFIVSGDKDFAQLVNENTFLLDTMKSKTYNAEGVEKKWGVPPEQMLDYLSLIGDVSDNIPGVRGIGPKGANKLLEKYKTLDGIYENIKDIKGHTQAKLKESKKQAYLSKRLIAIVKDIPLKDNFENFELKPDEKNLKRLFEELNFQSFLNSFLSGSAAKENNNKKESSKPKNKSARVEEWAVEDFKDNIPPYAHLWSWEEGDDFYLAYEKHIFLLDQKTSQELGPILDQKSVRYEGYDLKSCWRRLNCKKPIATWDLMVASHLLDSKISNSFFVLCEKYINKEDISSPEESLQAHHALKRLLMSKLEKAGLQEVYSDLELSLIPVLYDMEQTGMLIDQEELKIQSQGLGKDINSLEKKIHSLAGESFNVSSPKQLGVILFDKLNLPKGRKTKTGYSTDSSVLMSIKDKHPILPLILEYREFFKLKTTYVDALDSLVNSKTKRIHTQFHQTVTSTGRLSSTDPNLQNIPIRTERGRQVRKAFISLENNVMISADYSQIELRILAHLTEDPGLVKAFKDDLDIHSLTASEIFNIPLKEVSSELRRRSKAVNFGIAYGQGPYGLAESLGISRVEGKEIISNYFKKFKKVKDYMESIVEEACTKGYVETLFGRKRFFNQSDFNNPRYKSGLERAAINAPIQGTASDLVKKAMIELDNSLFSSIVCQVHDELLFECPKDKKDEELFYIKSIMEQVIPLKVPLKVNLSSGGDWGSIHN